MSRRLAALTVASLIMTHVPPAGAQRPAAPTDAVAAPDSATFTGGEYRGPAGTRQYRLFVPGAHERRGAPFLLVMLHGCTQDAEDLARGTRMNALAGGMGGMVLYPEQSERANGKKCWNWYEPANQERDAGEPAMLVGMIREVARRHGADARRIYVAGISAGGAMALLLAANYPELVAAAGVHSGVPVGAAHDVMSALVAMQRGGTGDAAAVLQRMGPRQRAVPLLVMHGTADAVVHPDNGRHIADQWAAVNGIDGSASHGAMIAGTAGGRSYTRTRYTDATGSALLDLWLVEGLGHAWSGGSAEGTFTDPEGPDASAELLRFITSHRLGAVTPMGRAGTRGSR